MLSSKGEVRGVEPGGAVSGDGADPRGLFSIGEAHAGTGQGGGSLVTSLAAEDKPDDGEELAGLEQVEDLEAVR